MTKLSDTSTGRKAPLRYLTLDEASATANTAVSTLRKWLADGRLTGYKPGRRLLVREDELVAFIESKAVAA